MTNELKFFQLIKICHFWNIFCLLCCDGSSHKKIHRISSCVIFFCSFFFSFTQYWKSQRLFWIIQMQHDKWVEFFHPSSCYVFWQVEHELLSSQVSFLFSSVGKSTVLKNPKFRGKCAIWMKLYISAVYFPSFFWWAQLWKIPGE